VKSKIDKTDAPKGYYAARAKYFTGCHGCAFRADAKRCGRESANCLGWERRDGQNVIFRAIKKGGTQ